MKRWIYFSLPLLVLLLVAACGDSSGEGEGDSESLADEENASENNDSSGEKEAGQETLTVHLKDKEGKEVGTAALEQEDKGVQIDLEASGLPEGEHGFHIHEKGACEQPDFKSAGGHFNPADVSHGTKSEDGPHAGDLKNINVGAEGSIQKQVTNEKVTLKKGEKNSLLKEGGTALVIHSGADDYKSQPSGDAGKRIACGVISE
ncbi:superoxide dismutase family protein [Halobacillus salinarum]|uniref:Superoxide dismutase [Cu-Zn] n=1 Tax=Halobacillus salinarum TaxID=2932257 RepID=A0ABY4EIV4_9BACI|nr:superoxide dismutase family protein [Halobacillus salinarum]UOQ44026.1 superoxide dismutase family protein [Halobacillus salinarum]